MKLECHVPLKRDEEVSVEISLARFPKPLELRGTVVHVTAVAPRQYHVGVRFTGLTPERRSVLEDLIRSLLRGEPLV
jgi:hypothetical protein